MMAVACLLHFGLSITALAIIGFMPMIFNFLQCAWAYSCYLTLREREIWTYLVILFIQTFYCILHMFGVGDDPSASTAAL